MDKAKMYIYNVDYGTTYKTFDIKGELCQCSVCKKSFFFHTNDMRNLKYCPACGVGIVKESGHSNDKNLEDRILAGEDIRDIIHKGDSIFHAIEDSFRDSAWKTFKNGKFTL